MVATALAMAMEYSVWGARCLVAHRAAHAAARYCKCRFAHGGSSHTKQRKSCRPWMRSSATQAARLNGARPYRHQSMSRFFGGPVSQDAAPLPVLRVPTPDLGNRRHDHAGHEIAADGLVPGLASADPEQTSPQRRKWTDGRSQADAQTSAIILRSQRTSWSRSRRGCQAVTSSTGGNSRGAGSNPEDAFLLILGENAGN